MSALIVCQGEFKKEKNEEHGLSRSCLGLK